MANGGGVGILAAEPFSELGGQLAAPPIEIQAALRAALPPTGRAEKPVDMLGDADAMRYEFIDLALPQDKGINGLVIVHCPTKLASSNGYCRRLGGTGSASRAAGLATFRTPACCRNLRASDAP